jgi:multiple sugar transport system substrate-binding protein
VLFLLRAQDGTAEPTQGPIISAARCDVTTSQTLTMWLWDDNWAGTLIASTEAWTSKYCNNVTVNIEVYPWSEYWPKLRAAAEDGTLPDIFNMSQDRFYFYRESEVLLDLQPYLSAQGVQMDAFAPAMIDPYRANDQLFAVPVNWDTVALIYNKDLFDAAELGYPTNEWTWLDFGSTARALTRDGVFGASVYAEYQAGYANWIAATGVPPLVNPQRTECTLNTADSARALQFLRDLQTDGTMPTLEQQGGASADNAFALWISGRVAMISAGTWKLPDIINQADFRWGVVELPRDPISGGSRAILHSVGYVAAADTAAPQAVGNLMQYLASDEGQAYFARAGGVAPASPSPELQVMWVESFDLPEANIQAFVNASRLAQGVTIWDPVVELANTELVMNIFGTDLPLETILNNACSTMEPFLAGGES